MECNYNILLVEDDEDDFIIIKSLIDNAFKRGVILEWVESYDKALSCILKAQPDILLVDYNLAPDKSGADLVKEVNQKGIEAPAILITGQNPEDIGNELVEELFAAVLYKNTLTLHALRETILTAVNSEM